MIESGWRVEAGGVLVADSRSNGLLIQKVVDEIAGLTVVSVQTTGSPPEIKIELSNGKIITTFADEEPQSQWTLFDRRSHRPTWLHVKDGLLIEQTEAG